MSSKPSVLSGIQPSSILHLGNYLGAIRNWLPMLETHDCYFLIVDLHAITLPQDPVALRQNTLEMVASYIAAGLDPEKCSLFLQSHIPAHAELGWVMTCFAYMGELSRMTQFKDKSQKQGANIPVGLFAYPVLMAADILLYQPQYVPVGDDQKQHIELTRDLAERFNNRFQKEVFRIPQPMIQKHAARIMDLQNPESKMSKSAANLKGVLFLNETDKQILQKIKSAVTDSGSEIRTYAEAGAGIRNLLDIYGAFTGRAPEDVCNEFSGKMYGHLKVATAELVVAKLAPIRDETKRLLADQTYLSKVLAEGAARASAKAAGTLRAVYDALGFIQAR